MSRNEGINIMSYTTTDVWIHGGKGIQKQVQAIHSGIGMKSQVHKGNGRWLQTVGVMNKTQPFGWESTGMFHNEGINIMSYTTMDVFFDMVEKGCKTCLGNKYRKHTEILAAHNARWIFRNGWISEGN